MLEKLLKLLEEANNSKTTTANGVIFVKDIARLIRKNFRSPVVNDRISKILRVEPYINPNDGGIKFVRDIPKKKKAIPNKEKVIKLVKADKPSISLEVKKQYLIDNNIDFDETNIIELYEVFATKSDEEE